MKTPSLTSTLMLSLLYPALSHAQADCTSIENDTARLACYDQQAGRRLPPTPENLPATAPLGEEMPPRQNEASFLEQRWELGSDNKQGRFAFSPYRPTYILLGRYSDHPNQQPVSPTQPNDSKVPYENTEAKFQISFKTKLLENILGNNGDLWFGYTQQSNWQVYNHSISAPFRETNYEPELIATLHTPLNLGPVKLRMTNLGLVHQSNGRSNPLSRSWNRVYAQFGLEAGDFSFQIKPWYRLPEEGSSDDNPDITDYIGRGELLAQWRHENHTVSLNLRHSLKGGEKSHGSAMLEWAFPLSGKLKGYVQLFSGYGESMIDYNHRQNTIGIGLSLVD